MLGNSCYAFLNDKLRYSDFFTLLGARKCTVPLLQLIFINVPPARSMEALTLFSMTPLRNFNPCCFIPTQYTPCTDICTDKWG